MRSVRTLLLAAALFFSAALPINSFAFTVPRVGSHWHNLDGFNIGSRDILILEDGSEWRAASPAEAYIAQSWQASDRYYRGDSYRYPSDYAGNFIYITPNYGLFTEGTSYPFYLNNYDRNESIRVVPVASPLHYGEDSYWVFGTNLVLGHITLVCGRGGLVTWDVSSSYNYILRNWDPNDPIVIGLYDGYLSCLSSYKHILINFNKADFVQARPH